MKYSESELNIIKKLVLAGFTNKEIARIVNVFNGSKNRTSNAIRQKRMLMNIKRK